jgi:hypothetical protein
MKALFNKFHRRINLVALLFSNSGLRNKTAYSEFRNWKILRVFSYKVWSLKVICGNMWKVFTRPTCASDFFLYITVIIFLAPERPKISPIQISNEFQMIWPNFCPIFGENSTLILCWAKFCQIERIFVLIYLALPNWATVNPKSSRNLAYFLFSSRSSRNSPAYITGFLITWSVFC